MKKATTAIYLMLVTAALTIMVGCGKEELKPTVVTAPTAADKKPEPLKTMFVSKDRILVDDSYHLTPPVGSGHSQEEILGESRKQYVTVIVGENSRLDRVVLVPSFVPGTTVNVDDAKYEVLERNGWKLTDKITVEIFKSEFGSTTQINVQDGESYTPRSIEDLKKQGYWKFTRNNKGEFFAAPDIEAMVQSKSLDGVNELFRALPNLHPVYLNSIRKGEEYPSGYLGQYIGSSYTDIARWFDAMPESVKVSLVDQLGPEVFKQTKDLVGDAVLRKYLVDMSWQQIMRINPSDYRNIRASWPHDDPNAVVAYLGYNKPQYDEMARVCLFWQRRGQAVFERAKMVASKQIGAAPASGGIRKPYTGIGKPSTK